MAYLMTLFFEGTLLLPPGTPHAAHDFIVQWIEYLRDHRLRLVETPVWHARAHTHACDPARRATVQGQFAYLYALFAEKARAHAMCE